MLQQRRSAGQPDVQGFRAPHAEAKASDATLALHTRETEIAALIERGWSRAALARQPEVAGTTVMWRLDRLTSVDVLKVDTLLRRIDEDQVDPPARKATGGAPALPAHPGPR